MLVELRQALVAYQDYHLLSLTPQAMDQYFEYGPGAEPAEPVARCAEPPRLPPSRSILPNLQVLGRVPALACATASFSNGFQAALLLSWPTARS